MVAERKLNLHNPVYWDNHRGGWKFVVDTILEQFHDENGTLFLSAVENEIFRRKRIFEPWVGVMHQVPRHYMTGFPDLERLLVDDVWLSNLKYCKGLFTISHYVKDYLESKNLGVPISFIPYVMDMDFKSFDLDAFENESDRKNLVHAGEFLRRFESFFQLEAPDYEKVLLNNEVFEEMFLESEEVEVYEPLSNEAYDDLLSKSIIFLDLIDAPANTLVLECLARCTPILVNRLDGVVEYLGEDYPFYFSSLEEASEKLKSKDLIRKTYEYLRDTPLRERIGKEHFIEALSASEVYQSLPIPLEKPAIEPMKYDVSLVICSYNRVYNMEGLLERFCAQDFKGSFEMFIWNNKIENKDELDEICGRFKDRLDIKLIHSTENYYCVIRPALASLVNSELILICDDDVLPEPGYISHFLAKHRQYGPESVICCRGHVFEPHELNEEDPSEVWRTWKHMQFYDESVEDREVHFLHADNCLIPVALLKRAGEYDWKTYDHILVDDYWLSYILSSKMEVPIWKVKADKHLSLTPCSDDPNIALFHNSKVNEQRVGLYIHHMRDHWPVFA